MKCESLSASRIKTFDMCSMKYFLEYHLGIESPPNFGALNGSVLHDIYQATGEARKAGIKHPEIEQGWIDNILEAFREDEIWKLDRKAIYEEKQCDICEYYQNGNCFIVDASIDTFDGCPKKLFDKSVEMTEKVLYDYTPSNPLNSKIISIEERFEIIIRDGLDEIPVVGYMDLVAEHDKETLNIVDYKTGNKIQSYKECFDDIQFRLYHFAARKLFPQYKHIIVTPWYLKSGQISIMFGPEQEEETRLKIIKTWHEIRNMKRPKRIAEKSDGSVDYSHFICKYLCSAETCKEEWQKLEGQGGFIKDD